MTLVLTLGLQATCLGQAFTGQVFLLAEDYQESTCEAFGECDCCTGDIFFLTADKFCYISRCISGDEYFTGKYSVKSNKLKLTFDTKYVSELTDDDYNVTSLETKTRKPDIFEFDIKTCGQKTRITHLTEREWRNGSRYDKSTEATMLKDLSASKGWKQLSH